MVSLKYKRQSGFTIVELLIVIVIIGILAGLVVTQILGATAKARDSERTTDLNQIANQLEAYYARTGGYPSAANLGATAWRTNNELSMGDSAKSMYDPSVAVPATPTDYTFGSTAPTAVGAYVYVPTPNNCVSPTSAAAPPAPNTGTFCTGYTLSAWLEATKTVYSKKNANQ